MCVFTCVRMYAYVYMYACVFVCICVYVCLRSNAVLANTCTSNSSVYEFGIDVKISYF